MLRSRLAVWLTLGGVLLVLAGVGLLSSVVADWEQAGGSRQQRMLTVNVDPTAASAATAGIAGITLKEAERLAKQWSPLPIAYEARAQTDAMFGSTAVRAIVMGVSGHYRDFTGLRMAAGTTIGPSSVDERSRVAVIGAKLADKLFHSGQVVGKSFELYGAPFTVIGVFDDESSLLAQMADDGIPGMLVPVTTLLELEPAARIATIQLAAKADAALRGEADAKQALRTVGYNPEQFRIDNGVLAHMLIAQLQPLLLFVCGAAAILMLARLIVRQASAAYVALSRSLAVGDWSDVLRAERGMLFKRLCLILAYVACAAGLWELTRFRPYIPPEWVPDMMIDLSFYMEKLRTIWQRQVAAAGYIPSPEEQLSAAAGRLTAALFLLGAAGLPVFGLGVRLWAICRVPVAVQLQALFLFIPPAAVAAFAAARWAGLDYRIDPAEYAVTGALFIVAIVHANTGAEPRRD